MALGALGVENLYVSLPSMLKVGFLCTGTALGKNLVIGGGPSDPLLWDHRFGVSLWFSWLHGAPPVLFWGFLTSVF